MPTAEPQHLYYLGPEGTFTHQAALQAASKLTDWVGSHGCETVPCDSVADIMYRAQAGDGWGVVAFENNVEGYVVPNLDMLIDAQDVAGFLRVRVNVSFDAFVTENTWKEAQGNAERALEICTEVTAHPHGLAQCKEFARLSRLKMVPAGSNGAACRDLADRQVALGPAICGSLYGLKPVAGAVEDFAGAHTDFLVVAPRSEVFDLLDYPRLKNDVNFESVIAFIPLVTGPGVLANLLDVLRDAGLNMTSLITRPVKGTDGTYSFIVTLDAAPWEERFLKTFTEIAEHGDWVKTLAVYPRRERPDPPVDEWMLPNGGVRFEGSNTFEDWQHSAQIRRELLW